MKLSVIIPNYNGALFIKETVLSFLGGFENIRIVVVDDASTDNSIEAISSIENNKVHLICKSINGGFASSVNAGLRYCQDKDQEFVLVANSDIELSSDNFFQIIKSFDSFSDSNVAILGFLESGDNVFKENQNISGFLFALRLSVVRSAGYLDEAFYMYGEEQDYFRRLLSSGFRIIQTGVEIKHNTEMSGNSSDSNSWLAIRNSIYLEAKNGCLFAVLKKIIVLFLIINRLYRKNSSDVSLNRVKRVGFIKGNVYLVKAIIWNIKTRASNVEP